MNIAQKMQENQCILIGKKCVVTVIQNLFHKYNVLVNLKKQSHD